MNNEPDIAITIINGFFRSGNVFSKEKKLMKMSAEVDIIIPMMKIIRRMRSSLKVVTWEGIVRV